MQQVNLYLDAFKRIEPPYSAKIILLCIIYSTVFAALVGLVMFAIVWANGNDNKTLMRELNNWQNRFEQAKSDYPISSVNANLVMQIESLDAEKNANEQILTYLQTHSLSIEQQSFSVYLLALTWVKEPGLWLTSVKISDGGRSLKLSGRAQSADLLPKYLQKIAAIDVFSEMNFKVFDMKRDKQGLKFVVSSNREEMDVEDIMEKYISAH